MPFDGDLAACNPTLPADKLRALELLKEGLGILNVGGWCAERYGKLDSWDGPHCAIGAMRSASWVQHREAHWVADGPAMFIAVRFLYLAMTGGEEAGFVMPPFAAVSAVEGMNDRLTQEEVKAAFARAIDALQRDLLRQRGGDDR